MTTKSELTISTENLLLGNSITDLDNHSPPFPQPPSPLNKAVSTGNHFLADFISATHLRNLPTVLKGIQQTIYSRVHDFFQKHLGELPKGICLATTGSDGRAEKSDRDSPMEIILIDTSEEADQAEPADSKEGVDKGPVSFSKETPLSPSVRKVRALLEKHADQFDPLIEVKNLKKGDNPLAFVNDKDRQSRFIPTRAIDAVHIYGDRSAFQDYQESANDNLQKLNGKQKKKFYTDQVKPAEKELASYLSRQSEAVNLETGALVYDPAKRLKSVKYGLLRCLQYKLAHDLLEAVQTKKIDSSLLLVVPKSVPEKIEFLMKEGVLNLSQREADELIEVYKKSNQWYLVSQIRHQNGIKTTYADPDELTEATKVVQAFVNKEDLIQKPKVAKHKKPENLTMFYHV